MVTIDAAYTLGVEEKVGASRRGSSPTSPSWIRTRTGPPKEAIHKIHVWGTVVGGRAFPAKEIRP